MDDDSLSPLLRAALRLFPRVWAAAAALWAVTILPGELVLVGVARSLGLMNPEDFAAASSSGGAWRVLVLSAAQVAIVFPLVMVHFWACIAVCDAVIAGGEPSPRAALSLVIARIPAQVWTFVHVFIRMLPLGVLAGSAAAAAYATEASVPAMAALGALVAAVTVYFMFRWTLTPIVTLLEGLSGGEAVRRSRALSGRRYGLFAFQYGVYYAWVAGVSMLVVWLAGKAAPAWFAGLASGAINAVVIGPLGTGMFTALYRREAARDAAPAAEPA